MDFNFDLLMFGGVGWLITMILLQLGSIGFVKTMKSTKESRDTAYEAVRPMRIVFTVMWIGFVLVSFAMNPMVRSGEQEDVGSMVIQHENTVQTAEKMHIEMTKAKVAVIARGGESQKELKEVDSKSADDYNKFLNSMKGVK